MGFARSRTLTGESLVSRRRHEYRSFRELQASIAELPVTNAVLDGEMVILLFKSPPVFLSITPFWRRGNESWNKFQSLGHPSG